jgi:exodeoxyribonuclease V beta subunit
MLVGFGVERRLLTLVDGERRMTNLLHVGELLHLASVRERLGPTGTLRWLGARRVEEGAPGALDSEAGELRLESDARAVKILTVHKSKGLEYPIVYCPFLWGLKVMPDDISTAFHDPADGGRLKIHLDPPESVQAIAEREQRAENMRVLYVALTRAKHRCSIVWGGIRLAEDTPLACTLHPRSADVPAGDRDDADLREDLAELVTASGGTVSVRDLVRAAASSYVPDDVASDDLRPRTYERKVDTWWRIGSFSALASRGRAHATSDEARDRDEPEEEAPSSTGADDAGSERVILDEFPRGAKAGVLLHSVLEDHDFGSRDRAELEALIRRKLVAHAMAKEGLETMLARGVDAMLDTPLDGGALTLRSVPRSRRVDELEFMLPVATAQGRGAVTTKRLADAFAAHASPEVPRSYADQLCTLGFLPLRGFLRGFVDLVFEHDRRFYVVDYKSNHLGSRANDYAPSRLGAAMAHADYYLQYHLYVVAVDRWLRRRMRGYDYETSFGGVLYLFARGMSPLHPPRRGVFFDRPTSAMVRALSEVLDG